MYGSGDVHEGGAGRTTQEVFSLPHQQNEMLEGRLQGTGSDLCMYSSKATSTMQHTIAYTCTYLHTLTFSHPHRRTITGFPSTSSSLVMSWSGSQSSVRLPSSSPSACTLLLLSYYGNAATSPSEKPSENVSKGGTHSVSHKQPLHPLTSHTLTLFPPSSHTRNNCV